MQPIAGLKGVQNFIREAERSERLYSTGANVVFISDDLYNVTGSTLDPPEVAGYLSAAWKQLLIGELGLSENDHCYVTNVTPPAGTSHPSFSVGGHMTTNPEGNVEPGEICYLMPLCYWHNSTARDGKRFEHSETKMLRLVGYMQGEILESFVTRLPAPERFTMLYFEHQANQWKHQNLSVAELRSVESKSFNGEDASNPLRVLLERSGGDQPTLNIKDSTVPK